jgi:hypothetical protein
MKKKIIGLLCVLFLFPVSKTYTFTHTSSSQDTTVIPRVLDEDSEISSQKAEILEKKLTADPNDLLSHTLLLTHYFEQQLGEGDTHVSVLHHRHIL